MKFFEKLRHYGKKGFAGVEYVIVTSIILIGSIGIYVNNQDTIKDTHKEGSILMSDEDAELITGTGTSGGELVSRINVTPSDLYIPAPGQSATATVTLIPDTSWRVGLKWQPFFNGSYTELSQENSGYKVVVKGLTKGVSKYKVTTTDGSTAYAELNVQVGQPSDFTMIPESPTIDMGETVSMTVTNSDDYWTNVSVEEWVITSGSDIVSMTTSEDKKTATFTANGTTNGGVATVKAVINDLNFGAKYSVYGTVNVNKDYFTTFDTNGGEETYTKLKAAATRTVTVPTDYLPTRTGYAFQGWKLSYGGTVYQPGDTYTMPSQDNTMTAQWLANNYYITYDLNYDNKIDSTVSLAYESKLGTLPTPTRNGYTLLGWYTDPTAGTKISSETTVPLNGATYYAHWQANDYTVTYDMNGANETYEGFTAPCDSVVKLNATAPTKEYYTFASWKSSFDNTTYASGANFKVPYQNTTLTAQWTANSYNIIYNTNSGTINDADYATTYTADKASTLPTDVTRSGYTFKGWYTTSDFSGSAVTSVGGNGSGGNINVYAKWQQNNYTITYDANGCGTLSKSSQTVTYQQAIGAMATTSKTGYSFAGWYTAASGGTQYSATSTWNLSADTTLYARCTANSYTITFNANGGSTPSKASMGVTYGSQIGAMATTSRSGYTFTGWYTAASGGTQYSASSTWDIAGNQTLYAHWTKSSAYVTVYNGFGGTYTSGWVTSGGSWDVGSPSATGYNFKGYTSSGCKSVSGTTVYVNGTTDCSVTANWTAVHYGSTSPSSWTSSSRTITVSKNNGSGIAYYTYKTDSTSCNYATANTSTSGYTSGQSQTYSNATYYCAKTCGTSNNSDGSTRCSAATRYNLYSDTSSPTGSWSQAASRPYTITAVSGGCSSRNTHKINYYGAYAYRNSWESGKAHVIDIFVYCNASNPTTSGHTTKFTSASWTSNCQKVTLNPNLNDWYEFWSEIYTYCVNTGKVYNYAE